MPLPCARTTGRIALGAMLLFAGTSHLTFARKEFAAQVPPWFPADTDLVVLASGVVELTLGGALVAAPRHKVTVGWAVAAFFVAIFPGNVSQLVTHTDAFGLTSDRARAVRLLFQPVLVVWALWSTGPGGSGGRPAPTAVDVSRRPRSVRRLRSGTYRAARS